MRASMSVSWSTRACLRACTRACGGVMGTAPQGHGVITFRPQGRQPQAYSEPRHLLTSRESMTHTPPAVPACAYLVVKLNQDCVIFNNFRKNTWRGPGTITRRRPWPLVEGRASLHLGGSVPLGHAKGGDLNSKLRSCCFCSGRKVNVLPLKHPGLQLSPTCGNCVYRGRRKCVGGEAPVGRGEGGPATEAPLPQCGAQLWLPLDMLLPKASPCQAVRWARWYRPGGAVDGLRGLAPVRDPQLLLCLPQTSRPAAGEGSGRAPGHSLFQCTQPTCSHEHHSSLAGV